MSAHKCPNCQERCFIWSGGSDMDESGQYYTLWGCGCCDYIAYEYDEKKQRHCPNCQSQVFLQSLLTDAQRRYWWCSNCNHTDTIELISSA